MNKLFGRYAALTCGVLSLGAAAQPADRVIPEVVVSADYRQAKVQEVASSISVLDEVAIQQRNAKHLEELLGLVPNLNFAQGSSRARFFQIRGIGERSQFVDPVNPSVGLMVDDIDFSGIGSAATLFDVEQVEVLRGPQGTRYGANALAGLINIKSRAPSEEPQVLLEASFASYDSFSFGAAFGGALTEKWLGRVAFQEYVSDGFIKNDFLNRDDTNERDETTLRGKLRYLASDELTLDLSWFNIDIDNGYDAFSLDNNRHTLSDEPGRDVQQSNAFGFKASWDMNEAVAVEALLGYVDSDMEYSYDEDWAYEGIHPDGYSSRDLYLRDRTSSSLELRLLSQDGAELFAGTTAWVLGFYALRAEEDLQRIYTYNPEDFRSAHEVDTYALFGQLDISLADNWLLTLGLRVEDRSAEYRDSEAVRFDPRETLWGGRVGLQHDLSDRSMLYASAAKGYKANGFNTDNSLDADLREFDSEYLWEFELGYKAAFYEESLQARLALFYDLRRDQQVKSSLVRERANGSSEFIDFVGNAAEGTNYGAELELQWLPLEALSFSASLGLLQTEFDSFINDAGADLSGREQAHAPAYQFALGAQYDFVSGWYVRLDLEGKDSFYFSDSHNEQSTAYELLHAKLGYRRSGWQIELWGRNLTDEDYYTRGFGGFGNDPRKGYAVEPYYQFGEPRLIGVTGRYQF